MIDKLDVERPQVLVEALIMEVDVSDGEDLGFSGLVRILDGDKNGFAVGSLTDGRPSRPNATTDGTGGTTDRQPRATADGVDLGDAQALARAAARGRQSDELRDRRQRAGRHAR